MSSDRCYSSYKNTEACVALSGFVVLSFRNHLRLVATQGNCGFPTEGRTEILFSAYLQLEERHKPTNLILKKNLSLKNATKLLMMLLPPVICGLRLQLKLSWDGRVTSCVRAVLNIHFQFMDLLFVEKQENVALLKPKNPEGVHNQQNHDALNPSKSCRYRLHTSSTVTPSSFAFTSVRWVLGCRPCCIFPTRWKYYLFSCRGKEIC